ncbi:aminopeptidase P family protein [Candidatus Peregrinibacteria bacterium]|nr:MAG: aminopeptidase P family protein [Candidatus Peregrinibacteria bacterium]
MISQRLAVLQDLLETKKLSGILLSDPFSVQFFCGFQSSNALLFILSQNIFLFTDARYLVGAREQFRKSNIEVRDISKNDEWKSFFKEQNIVILGTEYSKVTVAKFSAWKKYFGARFRNVDQEIALVRSQKSKEEIRNAEQAANIADSALESVILELRTGISEKEFAWKLEQACREKGAEKLSFESIVAFGENSAIPHHHPTERRLKENEAILLDWGVVKNGMCSDCSRSFFWGTPVEKWLSDYKKVLTAQQAGINSIARGMSIKNTQKRAEEILEENIPHSFGHGVGLEVHEYPTLSLRSRKKFLENMLVTAEPGIYRAGEYGIRIEDLLVVEKNRVRLLTHFSKDLEFVLLSQQFLKSSISSQKMRQ